MFIYLLFILIFLGDIKSMGNYTTNLFFYKPDLGDFGEIEKNNFDGALDLVDARLGKEIWVGAPGYGATFLDGLNKIGSLETTLVVPPGFHLVASSTTIPSNIRLRMEKGAVLNVADGVTLTINAAFEAGPFKIFNWTGTGKIIFGPGAVERVLWRWYGAKGDGKTDDTAAIQKPLSDLATGASRNIIFGCPNDNYLVSSINQQGTANLIIDGRGCTFTQSGTGNLFTIYNYGQLVIKNVKFVGSNQITPVGSCLLLTAGGNLYADNLDIRYFDKAIHLKPSLYNQIENCLIFYNNYGIYGENTTSMPNFNTFTNLKIAASKARAIYFNNGNVLKFDHLAFEGADAAGNSPGIATIENCSRVEFDNCYHEPLGSYKSGTTNLFSFSNSHQIKIASSSFAMGDNAGLNEAIYLTSNCTNVEIDRCFFAATNYRPAIYKNNGNTSRGITIRNSNWSGVVLTKDYIPTAQLEPNNYFPQTSTSWAVMQPAFVKMLASPQTTDYGWKHQNRRLNDDPINNGTNCTVSVDETAGYLNNCSYKINWTATNNEANFSYLLSPGPNQTGAYGILSFFAKGDIDQKIIINSQNGLISYDTPIKGDGKWYYVCQFIGTASSNPAGVAGFKISSDIASGNLWISDISMRWASYPSEAMGWVGTYCGHSGGGIKILPVNDNSPSVAVGPLDKNTTFKTQNTSSTKISRLDDGHMGQNVTLILNDPYTIITQWSIPLDYLYRRASGIMETTNYGNLGSYDPYLDAPTVDDCVYFGSKEQKFSGVRIRIGTTCNFIGTFIWEYWNGFSWVSLPVSNNDVWKNASGNWYVINWSPPVDWQQTVPSGSSWRKCYWLRCRLSSFSSGTEGGNANGGGGYYATYPQYIKLSNGTDLGPNSNSYDSKAITLVFDGIWRELSRLIH